MTRKGFLWALALVLAANVFVLAGVAYNRSGTPTARLVLTARELPLAWDYGDFGEGSENTGISLQLDWQNMAGADEAILGREKLEAIGFRFPAAGEKWDMEHRKSLLDRKAYAVLEYKGEAWAALLKAKQASLAKSLAKADTETERRNAQTAYDHFEQTASRLVLVDVGLDPASLRARYGDGGKYLIAKAKVSAYTYYRDHNKLEDYEIRANVSALSGTVHVPRQFHALIEKSGDKQARWRWRYDPQQKVEVPPYQVTLAYGQRYEPWVEEVAVSDQTKSKEPLQ